MTRMLLALLLTLTMFGAEAQKTPAKATPPKAAKPKVDETKPAEAPKKEANPDTKSSDAKPASAPDNGMSGYKTMDLDSYGYLEASMDGIMKRLDNGVKIRLKPVNPDQPDLTIEAKTMTFTYREGQKQPSVIHMEGHVVIISPQAEVRSEKADWDMEKNTIAFTGRPLVKAPGAEHPMESERFEISLNDKNIKSTNGRWIGVSFGGAFGGIAPGGSAKAGGTEAAGASGMTTGDVKDWTAFMTKIKTDAAADKPTPAKQIASLLDAKMREGIASASVEMLVQQKAGVLKELNRVMANPSFYTEAAWQGITLDADTKALLTKSPRTPEEQVRLNRLLLAAAYPELVAAPPAPKPKE